MYGPILLVVWLWGVLWTFECDFGRHKLKTTECAFVEVRGSSHKWLKQLPVGIVWGRRCVVLLRDVRVLPWLVVMANRSSFSASHLTRGLYWSGRSLWGFPPILLFLRQLGYATDISFVVWRRHHCQLNTTVQPSPVSPLGQSLVIATVSVLERVLCQNVSTYM